MHDEIHFDHEPKSNEVRDHITTQEPRGLRTRTPTLAVIEKSSGIYHWTADGRKLADFTSGVLVANLGHNPPDWIQRVLNLLGWDRVGVEGAPLAPLTTYNAISTLEDRANGMLLESVRATPLGRRLEQVMWSASGSEAVQKSLWAALAFQPDRKIILATRDGFHGKKGLAGAVTGDENSPERDPRVRFISFPKRECQNIDARRQLIDLAPYRAELETVAREYPGQLNCLITEPYLGGGGSYHPQPEYLQLLQSFCREQGMVFILDEVQSNFGRTGSMYAFETYGVEPDIVVLGKGMGNGVPVNAAVGRADVFQSLSFGGASDTWSGHPLGCAATIATLEKFQSGVLVQAKEVARVVERKLKHLERLDVVSAVRGEGHVWGVEIASCGGLDASEIADRCVRQAYLGDSKGNAIHLLGPLAGKVLRVSPPLTMTVEEAEFWFDVLDNILREVESNVTTDENENR